MTGSRRQRPPARDEVPPASAGVLGKGLKVGALGLLAAITLGVASVSPAYSLAATLGPVAAVVRERGPLVLLLAFIPMLGVAYAYQALNRVDPDCGTSFRWVARIFSLRLGWLTGWVILTADTIALANLAQISGRYTLDLFGAHGAAGNTGWQALIGCAWLLAVTVVAWIGIQPSARAQLVLVGLEVAILVAFAVAALDRAYRPGAGPGALRVSWSWLNPFAGGTGAVTPAALSAGLLLAVFLYWGFDSTVSVNEETRQPASTPGRAAVLSAVVVLVLYLLVAVGAQAYAGVGDTGAGLANPDQAGDVLSTLGAATLGPWGGKLLVIAVLTSAAAGAQTTIIPTARTALSMATAGALPRRFAAVSARLATPGFATWTISLVAIAFYAVLAWLKPAALADLIASVGLQIAFYYGLTGFAAVWYFRRDPDTGWRAVLSRRVLPGLGGVGLLVVFVRAAIDYYAADYGATSFFGIGGVFVLGVGSILLGLLIMFVYGQVARGYFSGRTVPPLGRAGDDRPADPRG